MKPRPGSDGAMANKKNSTSIEATAGTADGVGNPGRLAPVERGQNFTETFRQPAGAVPRLKVLLCAFWTRRDINENLLFESQISDQRLKRGIFLLGILHPPGLLELQPGLRNGHRTTGGPMADHGSFPAPSAITLRRYAFVPAGWLGRFFSSH